MLIIRRFLVEKVDDFSKNKLSTIGGVREPRSKMVVNFNSATSTNVDKSGCCGITNFDNKGTTSGKTLQNTPTGGEGLHSIKVDNLAILPRTQIPVPNPTYKVFILGRRTLAYCATFGAE